MTDDFPDDAARLAEWSEYLAAAGANLTERLGVVLDGSPESLVPLWTAARGQVCRAGPEGVAEGDLPAWARWPDVHPRTGRGLSADTLHLVGALAAYYGQVLQKAAARQLRWCVLRAARQNLADEGQIVLASPEAGRDGLPAVWAAPLRDVVVLAGAQLKEPAAAGAVIVGKDDPQRLYTLLTMRVSELGGGRRG